LHSIKNMYKNMNPFVSLMMIGIKTQGGFRISFLLWSDNCYFFIGFLLNQLEVVLQHQCINSTKNILRSAPPHVPFPLYMYNKLLSISCSSHVITSVRCWLIRTYLMSLKKGSSGCADTSPLLLPYTCHTDSRLSTERCHLSVRKRRFGGIQCTVAKENGRQRVRMS